MLEMMTIDAIRAILEVTDPNDAEGKERSEVILGAIENSTKSLVETVVKKQEP